MATRRKITYPIGLDKIAEQFGISTPELLEEIANGELIIVRPSFDDEDVANDAVWDKQFADSQDALDKLADSIHADYLAGVTEEFNFDTQD